jgi:hypothetical protein
MIGILKKVIHVNSGPLNQLLGFLAAFIVLLGEYVGVLYIAVVNKILPTFASLIFQFTGYIIGGLLFYYVIRKIPPNKPLDNAESETVEPDEINKVSNKNSSTAFVFNFLIAIGIIKLLLYSIPILVEINSTYISLGGFALLLISIMLLGTVIVTAWLITHNSASPNQYPSYFIKSTAMYFRNINYNIISIFIILLTSSIILCLHLLFWPILFSANFSPLLIIFFKTVTIACLLGWAAIFLMRTINIVYGNKAKFEAKKASPVGYVIIGLFLAAIIYTSVPKIYSIETEYEKILIRAENYRSEGKLYLCGNEYKKAYALIKAYNGYLLDIQTQKDKEATDEQINRIKGEADILFKQAYDFYPNGGKIYYLDALRSIDRNLSYSLTLAQDAKKYAPEFTDAYILILNLSQELDQKELITSTSKELIAKNIYKDAGNLNGKSFKKTDADLEIIDDHIQVCLENITVMAYDYYNNQLYPEAMEELLMIKEILPRDVVTNYLIAMTDLELKADNKTYTTAIAAAQTILDHYPGEKWAQELYTGVTIRAGNQNVMDTDIREAYEKNPEDLDIAEQYAYSILKKNYSSSYYEVTHQAEEVVDQILTKDSERWFAIYCKSLIELYKGDYESSLNSINHFSDLIIEDKSLFNIYDELYNTYVVKYARRMVLDAGAKEVLTTSDSVDAFTYSYVMGAFGTMSNEVDTLGTINFLTQALTYHSDFSKLYYMIGNAHMEYGYYNDQAESFVLAEDYYQRSIQIFENNPYAWFALAHTYKKQERYEEAMGAFQKTLTLMPAQDHQSDHFGISIHSTYQLSELESIIAAKEVQ